MSKSKPSRFKKWLLILAAAALVLTGVVAVLLNSPWAKSQARAYAGQAQALEKSDERQALVKYQMAATLDGANPDYQNAIAALYLRQNRPDAAIAALRRLPAGERSERIAQIQFHQQRFNDVLQTLRDRNQESQRLLKAKALLELGRAKQALSLTSYIYSNQAAVLQALIEGAEGMPLSRRAVSSPEAAETTRRVGASKLALAQELYAQELLKSSEKVLRALPDDNIQKFKLLAAISLAVKPVSVDDLERAKTAALAGLVIDPGDRGLRQLLRDVDAQLGLKDESERQGRLLDQLTP